MLVSLCRYWDFRFRGCAQAGQPAHAGFWHARWYNAAKARQQNDIAKRFRVAKPLMRLSGARSGGGYGVRSVISKQMMRMVRDRISTLGVPSIRRQRHDAAMIAGMVVRAAGPRQCGAISP